MGLSIRFDAGFAENQYLIGYRSLRRRKVLFPALDRDAIVSSFC